MDRVLLPKQVEDGVRIIELEPAQVFVCRGTQKLTEGAGAGQVGQ